MEGMEVVCPINPPQAAAGAAAGPMKDAISRSLTERFSSDDGAMCVAEVEEGACEDKEQKELRRTQQRIVALPSPQDASEDKQRQELRRMQRRKVQRPTMWGHHLPVIPGFTILSKQGEGAGPGQQLLLVSSNSPGRACYHPTKAPACARLLVLTN
eukprot:1992186-Pyramimonas_sp.AAC.1